MKKNKSLDELSRTEIIINELKCGGFTLSELDDIEKAIEKAREEK